MSDRYDELSDLVESLEPYTGLMSDEYGELLDSLLRVAGHTDYISNDVLIDSLIQELSGIKTDLETNFEIVEKTHTSTYKSLEEK